MPERKMNVALSRILYRTEPEEEFIKRKFVRKNFKIKRPYDQLNNLDPRIPQFGVYEFEVEGYKKGFCNVSPMKS